MTSPNTLYHYCSTESFVSMVRGASLWLSSLSLSNDTMEGRLVNAAVMRLAARDPDAICEAIASGRVSVESRPLDWIEAARLLSALMFGLEQPAERQRVRAVAETVRDVGA